MMNKRKLLYDGKKIRRKKCSVCKGSGQLNDDYINPKGKILKIKTICLLCGGTGYEIQNRR